MEINQIIHGDNIKVLKEFPDNYFHSVVTDPPYGLSFMNKHWDYDVPTVEFWKECLRVLKPGGHLLSFGGTRTYHRMTVNIEDAGFEIRDMISWIYGSGFPKSLDISKAIDKMNGAEREVIEVKKKMHIGGHKENANEGWQRPSHYDINGNIKMTQEITAPQTPDAIKWNGFGTALKPAQECICLARKPIEGTVANNVLKYGTGGINIDGCRIEINLNDPNQRPNGSIPLSEGGKTSMFKMGGRNPNINGNSLNMAQGRFPANIIFDEPAAELLDEMSGESKSRGHFPSKVDKSNPDLKYGRYNSYTQNEIYFNDSGGASRFFYVAKASKGERNKGLEGFEEKERVNYGGFHSEQGLINNNRNPQNRNPSQNNHPTVKPLKLMQYLVRLITPPDGICLDPFAGSGTTLMACVKEGFNYIGIEREKEYCDITEARVKWIKGQVEKQKLEEPELFT